MVNRGLEILRERRSVTKFLPSEPNEEILEQILDAGRWAPSWVNSQPWSFIVVTEKELKRKIGEICSRKTAFTKGVLMEDAAAVIVVAVNPEMDPYHHVEDGAIAAQNMALAAYSLGYGSYYLGIYDRKNDKNTVEAEIRNLLGIPEAFRVITALPVGIPETVKESTRTDLKKIVHHNMYGQTRI